MEKMEILQEQEFPQSSVNKQFIAPTADPYFYWSSSGRCVEITYTLAQKEKRLRNFSLSR